MTTAKGTYFKEDKKFEEKMTPCIDQIYRGLFSGICEIDRSSLNNSKNLLLDKNLAIDSILYFKDGTPLTFQEKTRENKYIKFNDFTIEYYNDPKTGEKGEWFKLAAQFYFYGYASENLDCYDKYFILNIPLLRIYLKKDLGIEKLKQEKLRQNMPPNKANFFVIPFEEIPDKCFLYKSI